mmetsp:Transcript_10977/g.24236  ORF Transcript_10977/g.24236 Transcript_10977/m.24236 type:complete len:219 (+) Transcript_10977:723-1379(+)
MLPRIHPRERQLPDQLWSQPRNQRPMNLPQILRRNRPLRHPPRRVLLLRSLPEGPVPVQLRNQPKNRRKSRRDLRLYCRLYSRILLPDQLPSPLDLPLLSQPTNQLRLPHPSQLHPPRHNHHYHLPPHPQDLPSWAQHRPRKQLPTNQQNLQLPNRPNFHHHHQQRYHQRLAPQCCQRMKPSLPLLLLYRRVPVCRRRCPVMIHRRTNQRVLPSCRNL